MDQALECITKKYAQFSGRAARQEFWLFALLYIIVYLVASWIDAMAGFYYMQSITMGAFIFPLPIPVLTTILSIVLGLPYLAVVSRRLHDTNWRAWWMLLAFIPLIGAIWLLVLFCLPGTDGENRFGLDPRTRSSE